MTQDNGATDARRAETDADFTAFVAAHGGRLVHIAELISGEPHRAADLAQEALERAYLRWDRIHGDDPMAYVRRILINQHRGWWRRDKGREWLSDHLPEPAAPEDFTHLHSDRDLVLRALATLTHRERQIVVLRYFADLSEAQTAAEAGIAPGTVKSTLSRALSKMRAVAVLGSEPAALADGKR